MNNYEDWQVQSDSRMDVQHRVVCNDGVWSCDCEAFKFYKKDCKHIILIKDQLNSNELPLFDK